MLYILTYNLNSQILHVKSGDLRYLPADVQSLPGVSWHSRHFPGTELNGRGVDDAFSRRLKEEENTTLIQKSHNKVSTFKITTTSVSVVSLCLPVWVCPARWLRAPAGCREGSLTAGGDSEDEPAVWAGCGRWGPEHWRYLQRRHS